MTTLLIFPLFFFFIFGRIFPYLRNSVPLGYDPGLYLYLFKSYSQIAGTPKTHLPDWIVSGYPPGVPILGKILSNFVAPEKILVPLIIFFSALLFFSVYLLAKQLWDRKVALFTVFIFCCSAIQYRVYWYYYLKNIASLSFLLLTFYFAIRNSLFDRKLAQSKQFAILFSMLTAYFHRPTFALLLVALMAGIIFEKKKRIFYSIVLGATIVTASIYYVPTFDKMVLPLLRPIFKGFIPQQLGGSMGAPSGSFYNPLQALALALLYLPFAIYGFKKEGLKRKNLLITTPLLVSLFIVVFRLSFFQRFIPFLDLFLIFFAGYGVAEFSSERNSARPTIRGVKAHLGGGTSLKHLRGVPWPARWRDNSSTSEVKKYFSWRCKSLLAGIYICCLIIFISAFIYNTGKPLIYEDELREIKKLNETEEDAYILVTDLAYTPWIYGWSNRKPITPGFGEYDIYWTISQWHKFWESGNRQIEHDLLLKLPKPLYIYNGDRRHQILTDFSGDCFERINWRTFKFICKK